MSLVEEAPQRFLVSGRSLALVDDGSIPLESISLERGQDLTGRSGLLPGWIDIVYADKPASALVTCLQIARSCREQRSKVKWPGR